MLRAIKKKDMDGDLPDPIADAAVEVGQLVRYLRLHRTSGNDYLHENLLEGYNNTHTGKCLAGERAVAWAANVGSQ